MLFLPPFTLPPYNLFLIKSIEVQMKTLLLSLIFIFTAAAQSYMPVQSIGNFRNANAFFINSAGFIYVSDLNESKLFKIDTLGNLLRQTGGFGWGESAFDYPADIFASPLNVYVADKNNHRVQWFDKDLNFLSALQTRNSKEENISFGYPVGAAVSNQGDLLVLDSENNRVLRFDMFGSFLMEFGGLDAGKYRVNRPIAFTVLNNITFVLDNRGKRIVVFDQFGTGLNIIKTDIKYNNISRSDETVFLTNEGSVSYYDLSTGEIKPVDVEIEKGVPIRKYSPLMESYIFLRHVIFRFSR
jgi:DNA-binding beta-propeller fold protein YncE